MENVETTTRGVLRNEKVTVRPIRRPSDWLPDGHDSQFMNEGSKWSLCVPSFEDKKILVDPLKGMSKVHKEELAELLGLENANSFNVYRTDSFWKGFDVKLDRVGKVLDLSNAHDFVTFKVLECNSIWIAPSWTMRNMKQTYKYALEFESDKVNSEIAEVNEKEKSYVALSKMSNSREIMGDFMWSYYLQVKTAQRPPINAHADWLKKEIGKIIDTDAKTFLSIVEDEDYPLKVLIMKALNTGALSRAGEQYRFPGGEFNVGSLQQMVDHLKDDRYQDDYLKLKTQINIAETTVLDQKVKEAGATIPTTPEPVQQAVSDPPPTPSVHEPVAQVSSPIVPETVVPETVTPEQVAPETVVPASTSPADEKSPEELAAEIRNLKNKFDQDTPIMTEGDVLPMPTNLDETQEGNEGKGDEKDVPGLDDNKQE